MRIRISPQERSSNPPLAAVYQAISVVFETLWFVPRKLSLLGSVSTILYAWGQFVVGIGDPTIGDLILAHWCFTIASVLLAVKGVAWLWYAEGLKYKAQRVALIVVLLGGGFCIHVRWMKYLDSKAPVEAIDLNELRAPRTDSFLKPPKEAYSVRTRTTNTAARPDVALQFVYPREPALLIINQSSSAVARDIRWSVVIWNTEHPEILDPLQIPTGSSDWIGRGERAGPQNLFSRVRPAVKSGDILIGSANVACPECRERRSYILYIEFGSGGWYAEIAGETAGYIVVPNDAENEIKEFFRNLEDSVPVEARRPIVDLPRVPAKLTFQ